METTCPVIQPRLSFLHRLFIRAIISLVRGQIVLIKTFAKLTGAARIGLVPKSTSIHPTRTLLIPSTKDLRHHIAVHVYDSPSANINADEGETQLRPVHINLHGSGFMIPSHGDDAEYCTFLAAKLGCTVLDADYRKSPAHPFPAPIDDVLDVVAYARAHSGVYDPERITIGGFSAGATAAILASLALPKGVVKSIIAWYPLTDFSYTREQRAVLPPPTGAPGFELPFWIMDVIRESCVPPGWNLRDAKLSPMYGPSEAFPPILFVVGEHDVLCPENVKLAKRLQDDGVDCEILLVRNATHGFERQVKDSTPQWRAREEANEMIERRLRRAFA